MRDTMRNQRATWRVVRVGSARGVVLPKTLCELYGVDVGDMLPVELEQDRLVVHLRREGND